MTERAGIRAAATSRLTDRSRRTRVSSLTVAMPRTIIIMPRKIAKKTAKTTSKHPNSQRKQMPSPRPQPRRPDRALRPEMSKATIIRGMHKLIKTSNIVLRIRTREVTKVSSRTVRAIISRTRLLLSF